MQYLHSRRSRHVHCSSLEPRGESFNVFNHAHFLDHDGEYGDATFGNFGSNPRKCLGEYAKRLRPLLISSLPDSPAI
jgi:hypothetical protein